MRLSAPAWGARRLALPFAVSTHCPASPTSGTGVGPWSGPGGRSSVCRSCSVCLNPRAWGGVGQGRAQAH